jgi:hypothetical protein
MSWLVTRTVRIPDALGNPILMCHSGPAESNLLLRSHEFFQELLGYTYPIVGVVSLNHNPMMIHLFFVMQF